MAETALTSADLRELADKLDGRSKAAAEQELQARVDRMEAALARGGLTEEQQRTLASAQALLDELDAEQDEEESKPKRNGKPKPKDDDEGVQRKLATRPGRKKGAAYDYDVDDQGRPVKLGTAKVYSGDDEPDEVTYEVDDDEGES